MKREPKIPTFVALILIVFLLLGMTVFTNYYLRGKSNASPQTSPKSIKVTTVTDNGFTVTWQSDQPVLSAVTVTDDKGEKQTFFDERHVIGDTQKYTMHSVPVRGLLPDTSYTVELLMDGKKYTSQEVSSVKTGTKLTEESNGIQPVYGSVFTKDNTPAEGALVFLQLGDNSQVVSTLVKSSGSWVIPLNLLRTSDFHALVPKPVDRQPIMITVTYNDEFATISTDTLNASPVPPVTLGNTYDFKGQQAKKTTKTVKTVASSFTSVLGTQSETSSSATIQLISPPNGAHIPGERPLFSGRGIPGNLVTLILGLKDVKTESTRVLKDGTWQFTPSYKLGIGDQRVTMSTLNDQQKPVAITHLFEIMKSGTQVLGDATPSATLAPTVAITPTIIETITPTPTMEVETPTPTPEVPTTATTIPTTILIFAGGILLLGGLLFLAF